MPDESNLLDFDRASRSYPGMADGLRQSANEREDRPALPWAQTSSLLSAANSIESNALPWAQAPSALSSKGASLRELGSANFSGIDSDVGLRNSVRSGKLIEKLNLQDEVSITRSDETARRGIAANRRQRRPETKFQRWREHIRKTMQFHQELVKKGSASTKKLYREEKRYLHGELMTEYECAEKYGEPALQAWRTCPTQEDTIAKHPYPRLRKVVIDRRFEYALTFLIVANCVIIGWQAGLDAEPEGSAKIINMICEQAFTILFFTELMARMLVFNWTFFFDSSNHLDIFLVALSVLNTWILGPLQIKADFLRKASVLRILRLVRIAKSYRTQFKEMWQLLRGIVDSLETLIWTYVMMGCVLYFFGIVATMLFTKSGLFDSDEAAKELADEKFSNVLSSMFTLYQVMTLDSWSAISRALAKVNWWVDIFFIIYISISVFLLMNLITAVIVDKAETAVKDDKAEILQENQRQKEEALRELSEVFKEIDEDGSGMIDKQELATAWKRQKVRAKFRLMDITRKDLRTLWQALSAGKTEEEDHGLLLEDFIGGISDLKGEAKAKDILKLYREVRILEDSVQEMDVLSDHFQKTAKNIKGKLNTTFREMDAVRRTLVRVKEMSRLAAKSQALTKRETDPADEEED